MTTTNMQTTLVRRFLHTFNIYRNSCCSLRNFSTSPHTDSASSANENAPISSSDISPDKEREEFLQLLRNSSFVNMGDPSNKIVRGKIFHVVYDDLYIDFGAKFHCVCPRPATEGELYVRGSEVLLKIKELELSSRFLGIDRALTLLEADASIISLINSPAKKT